MLEQIGDYRLLKLIGQGSLGSVYLAEHRFIKKQYVLKVLPQELAEDRGFIQRFEKEMSQLANLSHDHIVKVHDVSSADGYYFLVTDCIVDDVGETTNLLQYLTANSSRLTEKQVIVLLKQVASALDYLHQRQNWHGNLKLTNILVSENENGLHLYLSDVALSRIIGAGQVLSRTYQAVAESLASNQMTQLHQSFNQSFAFLAPEQKVHGRNVDSRSDVYAFGVLAYYLIMRTFPEGFFPLPSAVMTDFKLDWDYFFYHTLQPDALKRGSSCAQLLEELGGAKAESASAQATLTQWGTPRSIDAIEPALEQKVLSPKPVLQPTQIQRPTYDPDPGAIFHTDGGVAPYKPTAQVALEVEPIPSEMVIVHGGEFSRGSKEGARDERPVHAVHLKSFAIDVHPVTNEQYVRFLETMGGEKDSTNHDIIRLRDCRIRKMAGQYHIESGYAKHPVVGVTWYGALAYAKWVGKRLPTEAEWEVASKGGLYDSLYPTGSNIERSSANFFSTDTTAVMSYPPNGYGLFDMAGNVYEWCQDWYDFHSYDAAQHEPNNPKGPIQGVYRVLRGGCWKGLKEDMRCAHRHRNNPGAVNSTYGFRCATDVK